MREPFHRSFLKVLSSVSLLLVLSTPAISFAQATSTAELRSTIRAQLLSDPRTSGLSQAQLDAMVDLLAGQATKQGITAQDITWRPQQEQPQTVNAPAQNVNDCGNIPDWLCAFDAAFGFVGNDPTTPYLLGASVIGLIWILAEMIHRHKKAAATMPPPPTTM